MPESSTPAAAVLAVCTPWLAQFGAITWADLTITRPDGHRCTLSVPIAVAGPAPRLTPAPSPERGEGIAEPTSTLPVPPIADPGPNLPADARGRSRLLYAALTAEPRTKKAIFNAAKVPQGGDSYRLLRQLIRLGLAVEDGNGKVHLPRA